MNTERDNVALNDAALDNVSGGFNLYDAICNLGEKAEEAFMKGGKIGITRDRPGFSLVPSAARSTARWTR